MIRNIVFDMGNVLIRFDAAYIVRQFADTPEDCALLLSTIFRAPEWSMTDANTITEAAFEALLPERLPARLVPAGIRALRQWHLHNIRLPEAERLVFDLKRAGYRLYLLSNAALRFDAYWRDYPALTALDGRIVSAFVGAVKPEPAIYEKLFSTYGLTPSECYFVDDLPANVDAGRRMGMDGFVLDRFQYDALRADMQSKGIRI